MHPLTRGPQCPPRTRQSLAQARFEAAIGGAEGGEVLDQAYHINDDSAWALGSLFLYTIARVGRRKEQELGGIGMETIHPKSSGVHLTISQLPTAQLKA